MSEMKQSKVYLSIDLDYWHRSTFDSCTKFFQQVWALKLPICTAMYHHHLLPHMNVSDCDTLINIDWHSDLADLQPNSILNFGEGTWANFVDWRYWNTFIWRYPRTGGLPCHGSENPFDKESISGWGTTRKRPGLSDLPWKSIKAVGVCLSPDYIGDLSIVDEPLTKLKVRRWLTDFNKELNYDVRVQQHQPKTVRIR